VEKCRQYCAALPAPEMILAADSGYEKALALSLPVHKLVGDFDSMALPAQLPFGTEVHVSPCEKNETDTMLACSLAIESGAHSLLILGGTGGRVDHALSNIFYLEWLESQGIDALLTDGENRIRVCCSKTVTLPDRGGYFSVMSLSESSRVTLTGCKYPLTDATLYRREPYAVSNEVLAENTAQITVQGTVVVVESVK